jgi:hypothetical protein
MRDIAPSEAEVLKGELDETVKGIKGLQVLDTKLQATAIAVAIKLQSLIDAESGEVAGNIPMIIEGLCKLQTAFFNRGTQINIQNNNSNDSLAAFRERMRN